MQFVSKRLASLDVFRGFAIICMLLVDALPAFDTAYPWLLHTKWQGCSFADLAFPAFVFAMGNAGVFWLRKRRELATRRKLFLLAKRAALLFLFGWLLNQCGIVFLHIFQPEQVTMPLVQDISAHGRIMGVLQRLGLVYFCGMLLCWLLADGRKIFGAALVLLCLSSLGYRLYNPLAPFAEGNNLSWFIDQQLLGTAHTYLGAGFDPEGLYGTLNCTASMLFGYLAGSIMTDNTLPFGKRLYRLFLLVVILASLGNIWRFVDILSKPLWTAPYVLLTSALFISVLAIVQFCFDQKPQFMAKLCYPCLAFGMNPLVLFLATNVALTLLWTIPYPSAENPLYPWLWEISLQGFISEPFSILLFAVLWLILWNFVAIGLLKRRIFIKI